MWIIGLLWMNQKNIIHIQSKKTSKYEIYILFILVITILFFMLCLFCVYVSSFIARVWKYRNGFR